MGAGRWRAFRRRAVIRVGKRLRPLLDRLLMRFSLVEDCDVFDPETFPWVGEVTAEWRAIRDELDALLEHDDLLPHLADISKDHERIADGRWKVFFLHGYGLPLERSRERCPQTAALLDRVPDLYNAFFSILSPGIEVPRHRGVTKGFITWHIGLIVPDRAERMAMRLGDRTCHWAEGESLVFDDTRHHELWNHADGRRVVLLLNFLRPMRWPGRLLLRIFLAAMNRSRWVIDGRENHATWERGFETALRERAVASEEAA